MIFSVSMHSGVSAQLLLCDLFNNRICENSSVNHYKESLLISDLQLGVCGRQFGKMSFDLLVPRLERVYINSTCSSFKEK